MSDPTARDRGDEAPAQGRRPSDTEQLVGETAASRPVTGALRVQPPETASRKAAGGDAAEGQAGGRDAAGREPVLDDDAEAELGHS